MTSDQLMRLGAVQAHVRMVRGQLLRMVSNNRYTLTKQDVGSMAESLGEALDDIRLLAEGEQQT